jgi:hypothetical protein
MSRYGALFENIETAMFDSLHSAINQQPDGSVLPENDKNAVPVFSAQADVIRPQRSYVEFDFLTTFVKLGTADELKWDATLGKFKLVGQREFTMTVNIIGDGAYEYAALVQQSFDSPTIVDLLRGKSLVVRSSETIADRSVFLETKFEPRAVVDIRFGLCLELVDTVQWIEFVELVNKLSDETTVVDIIP